MVKIKTLSNGIRLVTEDIPHVQSVSIGVWVRAGAVFEPARSAGISHFIEHMLFKGTHKRSAKRIAEDVDRIGGHINAFTGKEATCYYLKTLGSNFSKGADILSDMFLSSRFDRVELDKEREVVCEEIKMVKDSPEEEISDLICEELFHGSPLAKSVLGTPSSLANVKPATIRAYMRRHYTKAGLVLTAVGRIDEGEVCEELERLFEATPQGSPHDETIQPGFEPRFRAKEKDIEQSHICLATKGVSLDDSRYYSMMLLNSVMGGNMSSRLFQALREQKGLAYAIYSANNSFRDTGYFDIYAAVSHKKVKKAVTAIMEQLMGLESEGVTEDELSMAKEQMKGHYIFSQESVNGRMFTAGKNCLLLGKTYTPQEVIEGIDSVTLDDIKEVSKLVSDPGSYSGAIIGRRRDMSKLITPRAAGALAPA
ncbi:MAG: insulinase family protein [Clostridiales Family XIII bacterium]|jgi:predicted Zn-dependent peptidase|nr:insulinase family protein [Clostridiales Family XIII bacterium]